MLHDIVSATYLGDYRIALEFDDGQRGVVDLAPYAERGGVFERFRDLTFFRAFRIHPELGTLVWGDAVDVAPETLYTLATGAALPDWMTPTEAVA